LTELRRAASRAYVFEAGGAGWLRNWVAASVASRKVASETLATREARGAIGWLVV
jgi:hypothetical protein